MSLLAGFCALAMPCAMQAGYDFDENGNAFATGQAIVGFKPGTTLITAKSILARYGADPSKIQFLNEQTALVKFNERKDVLSFCQQMRASGWSPASGPNNLLYWKGIPNDPYYSLQWGLKPGTIGGTATVGADFQGASSYVTTGVGSGVKVAVIDTGIDLMAHPELLAVPTGPLVPSVGSIYRAMTIIPALPAGSSSNPPYIFATNAPNDDVGHGTHVAGIIAARTSNAKGVAGAAPGSIIYPIKIMNRLGGTEASAVLGIQFAATNGCRVINMSFGATAATFAMTNAILFAQTQNVDRTVFPNTAFKGVVCVASMGNNAGPARNWPVVLPGIAAVGAHGPAGALAAYSTTGPHITLAAPGGDGGPSWGGKADNSGQIFSTYPQYMVSEGQPLIPKPSYVNYSYMSGTSMAAPHVAAAAAMLLQKKPYLSQAEVWAQLALFSTHTASIKTLTNSVTGAVTQIPDTACDNNLGFGLLNANSLLQAKQPALGKTTGIPHVFPISPRNHFTYTPGALSPFDPTPLSSIALTGLQTVDVVKGNATNTFRVVVVDDKGERIPNATVTARFTLLNGLLSPLGFPTSNIVDNVMADTTTTVAASTANGDLLPNDGVHGCKIFFQGSFSNCLYEVRYLVTAPGKSPNTNTVVNIQVR